jgi:hypothetical protein
MVAISNNPKYPNFKRKVDTDNIRIIIDCKEKYVMLDLFVYNFSDEDILIEDVPEKRTTLTANNTTLVDQNGVPSEDGIMGEFDFFVQMMSIPVVINDIVLAKIAWADSQGRFN